MYVINTRNQNILSKVPNERICSRCGQTYMVDRYGLATRQQNCIYHWGRKFTVRGEGRYSCCQQYGSATGCCDARTHVWDYTDYDNLRGYVKTLSKGGCRVLILLLPVLFSCDVCDVDVVVINYCPRLAQMSPWRNKASTRSTARCATPLSAWSLPESRSSTRTAT